MRGLEPAHHESIPSGSGSARSPVDVRLFAGRATRSRPFVAAIAHALRRARLVAARTAMAPTAPMQRKPVGLALETVGLTMALVALTLGLAAAGNESRQAGLLAASGHLRPAALLALVAALLLALVAALLLALVPTLLLALVPTLLLALVAALLLALVPALAKTLLLARERLAFSRQVRLRLAGAERLIALLARHVHLVAVLVTEIVARFLLRPVIRVGLAELLLRGRDQAQIMLGVLKIVLGRHRVARRLGVAGELDVLVGHV